MINTVAKGTRKEKACADELEAQGYKVWRKVRTKWHNLDIFNLFDVLALSPDGEKLLFIQTKANRCDVESRDRINAFKLPGSCEKWIWIWKDRKYWIKEYYD